MKNDRDNFSIRDENSVFKLAMFSSMGDRQEQQDCSGYELKDTEGLVTVCDGMGGHEGGKLISNYAVELLLGRYLSKDQDIQSVPGFFCDTMQEIDSQICNLKKSDGSRLLGGSTCVAVLIKEGGLNWVSVGDSRIYLFRDGELAQLTKDHVYRNTLDTKLEIGLISAQEYEMEAMEKGEYLTSFLGVGGITEIDFNKEFFPLRENDEILLASDGLYKYIQMEEVKSILINFSNAEDALHALEMKVKRQNRDKPGLRDNMTLALIKMK